MGVVVFGMIKLEIDDLCYNIDVVKFRFKFEFCKIFFVEKLFKLIVCKL